MKSIKIGIIGAGCIGRVHAENIAKFVTEMEIKTIAGPYMSQETIEFLQRLRIPNIVKDADCSATRFLRNRDNETEKNLRNISIKLRETEGGKRGLFHLRFSAFRESSPAHESHPAAP